MAVLIQFTTLVIRVDRLTAVDPDGVAAIQRRWSPSWRDDHLLAVAFMDMGARDLAAELEQMGLTLRDAEGDGRTWRDVCVVDYYEGPTLPCAWLAYDAAAHVAWLAGTPRGAVAGPDHPHEAAPVRVSPDRFAALPAAQRHQAAPTHESVLLPLAERLADELVRAAPPTAALDALIFHAHFPRPGEYVTAGVILHDVGGETRRISTLEPSPAARELLAALAAYESGQRLTTVEIKIAGDGRTTTQFGVGPPLSAEALAAQLDRLYASIPEAPAPAGGLVGFVRGIFSAAARPLPALVHAPQREPLSLFLDELRGIREPWADDPPAPRSPLVDRLFALAELHALEAAREAPAAPRPAADVAPAGPSLAVPAAAGVLLAEVHGLRRVALAELHRDRPELRLDPIAEALVRDLGPDLGPLRFAARRGEVDRFDLAAGGVPDFDALLARLGPVLAALGGLGPLVGALGARRPAQVQEAVPVDLAALRAYLVADSPHATTVYPCWLLGAPAHVEVGLDLTVTLVADRPAYGWRVAAKLI